MPKISRFVDEKDPLNKDKFKYLYPDGTKVTDKTTLEWINSLRIPPAWTQVTIFYNMSSKQTCCGYDAVGRLQCLYSAKHREKARAQKYCDLITFGEKLPSIQNDIKKYLESGRYTKLKIIALILRIVMCCSFRLGTLTYEAKNDSYGITTIRRQHVKFANGKVVIAFIGKKGVHNECVISDPIVVKILSELVSIKKEDDHVMMYNIGGIHGQWIHIKHTDVNVFLREYGETITSKDFRTFQSNMILIDGLKTQDPNGMKITARKKVIKAIAEKVADIVHNTPAISKKDYIDPEIIDLYINHPVKYRKMFITPNATARIMFLNWLKQKC